MPLTIGEENEKNEQPKQNNIPPRKEIQAQEDVFKMLKDLTDKVNQLEAEKANNQSNKKEGFNKSDTGNLVQQLADAIKLNAKPELDYEGGIPESEMDTDDYDEKGTRFCCPRVGYVITDDKRKNQRVKIPYNKKSIFFSHIGTRILKVGKYDSTAPICAYISHSKKETAWLREHTMYKVDFYENANDAAHADSEKIQRMSTVMTVLKNYELPQLMSVCTTYGIGVTPESPEIMRMNLAIRMTDDQMKQEKERTATSMNEAYKAQVLLERRD